MYRFWCKYIKQGVHDVLNISQVCACVFVCVCSDKWTHLASCFSASAHSSSSPMSTADTSMYGSHTVKPRPIRSMAVRRMVLWGGSFGLGGCSSRKVSALPANGRKEGAGSEESGAAPGAGGGRWRDARVPSPLWSFPGQRGTERSQMHWPTFRRSLLELWAWCTAAREETRDSAVAPSVNFTGNDKPLFVSSIIKFSILITFYLHSYFHPKTCCLRCLTTI